MISRRVMLMTPLALTAGRAASGASGKMTLAIHQNTSAASGYRKSLGGHTLAFSILMNGVSSLGRAHDLQDDMAQAIAGYRGH